jgi:myosin-1
LVLSADAGYCNFICLTLEGTDYLRENGDLPWKHIRERSTLHGSLQQLLYGSVDKNDPIPKVTTSNGLREKLEFILAVVEGWIEGGGLGCLEKPKDFSWGGQQLEENKKLDWSSVGRQGGDA